MRILFCILIAFPVFAQSWIGWKIPTNNTQVHWKNGNTCKSTNELLVAVRLEGGVIERVKLIDPVCDPDLHGLQVTMQTKTPAESLDFLASHLETSSDRNQIITAIALHEHEKVVPLLVQLARHNEHRDVRRHAI
ncbi:MAG: HEAT repeat domain-containing protein, partial [Thermoanaerobaculia bacterium]